MKKILCISMIILLFLMTSIHVVYAREVPGTTGTDGVEDEPEGELEDEIEEEPDPDSGSNSGKDTTGNGKSTGGISTKFDSDFINEFKPGQAGDEGQEIATVILDQIVPIVNRVLGIIQVFGIILTIISVAIFGFNVILSNSSELLDPLGLSGGLVRGEKKPGDQEQIRKWMWLVLIGAILLFMSSTIVKIVFKLLLR